MKQNVLYNTVKSYKDTQNCATKPIKCETQIQQKTNLHTIHIIVTKNTWKKPQNVKKIVTELSTHSACEHAN